MNRSLTCGCLGCRREATKRIRVPNKGVRTTCDRHGARFEVIERV